MRRLLGAVGRPLAHTNGTGRGPAEMYNNVDPQYHPKAQAGWDTYD